MQYVNCGSRNESADFFEMILPFKDSLNCSDTSIILQLDFVELFSSYSIPSIITFRCSQNQHHEFREIQVIYGDEGSKILSGCTVNTWLDSMKPGDPELGTFS
jgi:hypothetical protein